MRPWINKKIIEYIGEEEPTLVDFVCSKVFRAACRFCVLEVEETRDVMFGLVSSGDGSQCTTEHLGRCCHGEY